MSNQNALNMLNYINYAAQNVIYNDKVETILRGAINTADTGCGCGCT